MLEDIGIPPFLAFMLVMCLVGLIASVLLSRNVKREQDRIDKRKAEKKTEQVIRQADENHLNEKTPAHV